VNRARALLSRFYSREPKSFQPPKIELPESLPRGEGLILLVDDEISIVDLLKDILVPLGYEVARKYNGSDALQAFKAHPESFDLVITDLTMPRITGIDLAREIQKIRADIPIILCTGFSEWVDESRTSKLGISGFLRKPVGMRELAESVSKILAENKSKKSKTQHSRTGYWVSPR